MPDSQKELRADQKTPFSVAWFETRLGTRYELPDMLDEHVDSLRRQLDGSAPSLTLINVSDVTMVIPKRILLKAGVGKRCFWEDACPDLNPLEEVWDE